jgi:uncharacterized protein YkwD
MRSLLNIIIMVAIVWGGWNYLSKNTDLLDSFKGSVGSINLNQQSVQEAVKKLSTGIAKNLGSLTQPIAFQFDSSTTLPGPLSKINTNVQTSGGPISRAGIIAHTNTERTKESLSILSESSELDNSAQVKAQDILTRQYFEHTAPDGTTSSDLATRAGYSYLIIGENLALGNFTDDADVVTAWMASPGHRANILKPEYQDIGVGVSQGLYQGHTVWVIVQHFGRPRSACPTISSSLKALVEAGEKEITQLAAKLNDLNKQVQEGRAQGKDMNTEADTYNAQLATYNARFAEVNNLRLKYNEEVRAFNSCLGTIQTTAGGH